MIFRKRIHELRKSNQMTQEDLAKKLNISRHLVARWEQGIAMPDIEKLLEIAKVFGVTTDYLLKKDEEDFSYYPNHIVKKERMENYEIISIVFLVIAILSIVLLVLISLLNPLVYVDSFNNEYTGIRAYWFSYWEIRVIMVLCFVIIPLSIILIILPKRILLKLLKKN